MIHITKSSQSTIIKSDISTLSTWIYNTNDLWDIWWCTHKYFMIEAWINYFQKPNNLAQPTVPKGSPNLVQLMLWKPWQVVRIFFSMPFYLLLDDCCTHKEINTLMMIENRNLARTASSAGQHQNDCLIFTTRVSCLFNCLSNSWIACN